MKKENIFKPFLRICIYYLVYILIVGLCAFVLNKNNTLDNIMMTLIDLVMVIFVSFLFRKKLKGQLSDFKKNWKHNLKVIFKYWLIGLVLMMVSNLIINVLIMDGIAPNEETNRSVLTAYPIYAVISMCFLTPIIEETLYRLNFRDVFKSKKVFVLTTGIIFGAMHVVLSISRILDLLYLIPYTILGCTFGLIFYNTKNVTSSMIAHMLHNTFTIVIVFLSL